VSVAARLAAFAGVLALLLGGGALAGAAIGPEPSATRRPARRGGRRQAAAHGAARARPSRRGPPRPRLAVADRGLRSWCEQTELRRGADATLRFRIVDDRGATVRDFDVEHDRRMHLIVARRDLRHFQHVHPRQAPDGHVERAAAPRRRGLLPRVRRLHAARRARSRWPPTCASTATRPRRPARPALERRDRRRPRRAPRRRQRRAGPRGRAALHGQPRRTPGRGRAVPRRARHLVALREGDLAFLHVTPPAQGVRFAATFPTAGRYRLFLQVKVDGRVHTVAFTQEVG
jgi:hypothetical protein